MQKRWLKGYFVTKISKWSHDYLKELNTLNLPNGDIVQLLEVNQVERHLILQAILQELVRAGLKLIDAAKTINWGTKVTPAQEIHL